MWTTVATAAIAGSLLVIVYAATGPPPRGGDRLVSFTNKTREAIVELHVSAVGSEDWQGDLLGTEFLPPGDSMLVDIADRAGTCRVDVKFVFDDGSERVNRGVDVCRVEGWAVALR
jgi:hypothetical protein